MGRLRIALCALALGGCDGPASTPAPDPAAEPVANEAISVLTDEQLADLRRRGEAGDLDAMSDLHNHFGIAEGDTSEEGIYWQLQRARHGDCDAWKDLMFSIEDGWGVAPGYAIPARYFEKGETLRSIGAASGCPPYVNVPNPNVRDSRP